MSRTALAGIVMVAVFTRSTIAAEPPTSEQKRTGADPRGYFSWSDGEAEVLGDFELVKTSDGRDAVVSVSWAIFPATAQTRRGYARGCAPASAVQVHGDQVTVAFDSATLIGDCEGGAPILSGNPGTWVGTFIFFRGLEFSTVSESDGNSIEASTYRCACNGVAGVCNEELHASGVWTRGTANFEGTIGDVTVTAPVRDHNAALSIIRGLYWARVFCDSAP